MDTPIVPNNSQTFFDTKEGIFENTANVPGINTLRLSFDSERSRLRSTGVKVKFHEETISISELKARIESFQNAHDNQLSHLALFYGFQPDGADILFKLAIRGATVQGNGPTIQYFPEIDSHIEIPPFSNNDQEGKTQRALFESTFEKVHGPNNYIKGIYIRLKQGNYTIGSNTLFTMLNDLEEEGADLLSIDYGYMQPDEIAKKDPKTGLTCFHLIFSGRKSGDLDFTTERTFSTFDNDSGYSGPKPSCPPFCDQ